MIAVIFEVEIDPERGERYFELAGDLRTELEQADGFLSIERFQSLTVENKYVSLSFWRDRAPELMRGKPAWRWNAHRSFSMTDGIDAFRRPGRRLPPCAGSIVTSNITAIIPASRFPYAPAGTLSALPARRNQAAWRAISFLRRRT